MNENVVYLHGQPQPVVHFLAHRNRWSSATRNPFGFGKNDD